MVISKGLPTEIRNEIDSTNMKSTCKTTDLLMGLSISSTSITGALGALVAPFR